MSLGCPLKEQSQGLVAGYATAARRLVVENHDRVQQSR